MGECSVLRAPRRVGGGVGVRGGIALSRPRTGSRGPSQSPAVAGLSSGVPSGDWWATCEWTRPRGAAALGVTHVPCGVVSCHALRLDRRDRTLQPLGGSAVTDVQADGAESSRKSTGILKADFAEMSHVCRPRVCFRWSPRGLQRCAFPWDGFQSRGTAGCKQRTRSESSLWADRASRAREALSSSSQAVRQTLLFFHSNFCSRIRVNFRISEHIPHSHGRKGKGAKDQHGEKSCSRLSLSHLLPVSKISHGPSPLIWTQGHRG